MADKLMTIEVFSEILASTDPDHLGQILAEQLRELTGARTVMLLAHLDGSRHDLIHVCPERRRGMFTEDESDMFCPLKIPDNLPRLTRDIPRDNPLHEALIRNNIESCIRFPLFATGDLVAELLLFDIPGLARFHETEIIIGYICPIMALALRNSFSHQKIVKQARALELQTIDLENRVAERTGELVNTNSILEESRMTAVNLMENAVQAKKFAEETLAELQNEIIERKRAEEEIQRKNRELEARNKEFEALNEDLVSTNNELFLSEKNLKHSLNEKETLLRELYHRTKNTLQIVLGILTLQSSNYSGNAEIEKFIKDADNRIHAIALVHQMLYKSQDLSRISIREYFQELTALMLKSYEDAGNGISLEVSVDELHFLIDSAIPCGMILNELLSNSLKYAFPGNRTGKIFISLTEGHEGKFRLCYSDNGVGVPPGFDFRTQETLGLKLIFGIGEQQLQGTVSFENRNGISCIIEFPPTSYQARV